MLSRSNKNWFVPLVKKKTKNWGGGVRGFYPDISVQPSCGMVESEALFFCCDSVMTDWPDDVLQK